MTLWLQAIFLMTSSKKGISSNQLHRTLGVTFKTAWFMSHRIRLVMQTVGLEPMGGEGEIVEVDETIIGKVEDAPKDASFKGSNFRNIVLTLVQRDGVALTFHVSGATVGELKPIITANVDKHTSIMTDEGCWHTSIGKEFASHDTVHHGGASMSGAR